MPRHHTICPGDILFITEAPNKGTEVTVVGYNLEGDPICQAENRPLIWRSVPRHVLDIPAEYLSWDPPQRPIPEILQDLHKYKAIMPLLKELEAHLSLK